MKKYLFLYISAIFASLGGLLSGYDTGVISGALIFIKNDFEINAFLSGILVGSVSFGAIFGALINGLIADKLGRKKILLISALIFFLGSIFCAISKNPYELIIFRILIGCGVGVVSFACPLYLSEISPKEKRGHLVSFYQLSITLGILFSYLVNYFYINFSNNWRLMLLMGAIPALILFIAMLFLNDTPRWLVLKNKYKEAKKVIKKINTKTDAEFEINEIIKTLETKQNIKISKKLSKPFLIGIGMMFIQITTGINAIIYFAPSVFKTLGYQSNQEVLLITVFIGLINFLMTFVAIGVVDKLGRKPLLYIGLTGMTISLLTLSFAFVFNILLIKYLAIIACALYIIFFSMSLGPVALLLISEIFPLEYRSLAMSISIVFNFIFNFIVTGLFPVSMEKLGGHITFLIFNVICVLSIIFIKLFVPETKGISLEEIEAKWN